MVRCMHRYVHVNINVNIVMLIVLKYKTGHVEITVVSKQRERLQEWLHHSWFDSV